MDAGSGVNIEDPLERCVSTQLPLLPSPTLNSRPGGGGYFTEHELGPWLGKEGLKLPILMEVNTPCLPPP